ncbi:MAG TPA: FAD-dependent oxidoreductase [Thermodesulfovibrionales bacterium]|nr:FAD-dependent oxidoreductase [Thermodesulfovibrionales bacterium]
MPKYDYDLVVIGGGAAGFVSAKFANGLGKKVAIVEKDKLGGDCTWYGCVPSKALLKASHIAYQTRHLSSYGLLPDKESPVDSGRVMAHVRSVVQKVAQGHLPETFTALGINVLLGTPRFRNNHELELGDTVLSAGSFIISTGSSPFIPPVPGIDTVPYLTNKTIFDIDTLPESMVVIGGGPIGIELASALNRLGMKVSVVHRHRTILNKEEDELTAILTQKLREEGITFLMESQPLRLSREQGKIRLDVEDKRNNASHLETESVLIAVGRRPNVEGLNLEGAGVMCTERGVQADTRLRTTAPNIYACGDVVGPYLFSHMAEYQALIAARNAFLPFKKKTDYRHVVWCTFTDPELAHAGLTEQEAREIYGDKIGVYRHEYRNTDRGKTDVAEIGIAKFICNSRGRLVGAHILGSRAADVIHEAQLVKSLGIPFSKIYSAIHIYPTFSDVIKHPSKLSYIDSLLRNPFLRVLKKIAGKNGRQ